jgi:hypothetical protein
MAHSSAIPAHVRGCVATPCHAWVRAVVGTAWCRAAVPCEPAEGSHHRNAGWWRAHAVHRGQAAESIVLSATGSWPGPVCPTCVDQAVESAGTWPPSPALLPSTALPLLLRRRPAAAAQDDPGWCVCAEERWQAPGTNQPPMLPMKRQLPLQPRRKVQPPRSYQGCPPTPGTTHLPDHRPSICAQGVVVVSGG